MPQQRVNRHEADRLVMQYLQAYRACDGSCAGAEALFDAIPTKDYRVLKRLVSKTGIRMAEREAFKREFNGSSGYAFFECLEVGARCLGISIAPPPAPQQ